MQSEMIHQRIARVKSTQPDDAALAIEAVELAAELLAESRRGERFMERRQASQLARMMHDPAGKAFTLAMADQVFRPPGAERSAECFRQLVDGYGVPEYLSIPERLAMEVGANASRLVPGIVMPAITRAMRAQSASVILPSDDRRLRPLLNRRRAAGMRMNLNQLGEAILGEEEAENRIQAVIDRLASPDCDYISVKISAIFSQIHLIAEDETLDRIADRLRRLYRAAIAHPARDGRPKFVNLDMEEYRDLHLTCEAFRRVLDEPEFIKLQAGIVLQAYLPDSWPVQRELSAWARSRIANGGSEIKIRIVKGANLAMESVDAEIHDWPCAVYATKEEVDANFKRMLHEACLPENAAAVRIGLASHNLFDVAYALLLRAREGVEDKIEFEMLEGMANHQARTVHQVAGGLLLYAPVVSDDDFHSAIAYLVRRLDENTAEENFLRDQFGMEFGDPAWERQRERFLRACARKDEVSHGPRRQQDRSTESPQPRAADEPFDNEADTDWALPANVRWIRGLVAEIKTRKIPTVPMVIAGQEEPGAEEAIGDDPSRPGIEAYRHGLADAAQLERALDASVTARKDWQALSFEARADLLRKAAAEIARCRGEAIATMVLDAGKAVSEADAEVSEAIDFAYYYTLPIEADGAQMEPLGTVLIAPPWNFPFAIPCGGVLAALVTGNTVILKPAPETVLTAWVMAQALWRAGIPRDVLQFLPCPNVGIGEKLITDSRIGAVVLTGGYETAQNFLKWKPSLRLFAETSGKNVLIITSAADPDQAVKDLVRSAFGHAGQKCSAASLSIIEADRYDDPGFRRQLRDAASSLIVGGSWNFDATLTPVIRKPRETLHRALTTLEPGEEWLLEPQMIDGNPCLWSPGIKLGISPEGWFRRTECFGPVLGLIRAEDLEDAIRIQNDSEFALTGGIHSLDDAEIALWKERVEVGNAYINRPITGAIVRRQAFGGWKRSCFGPGAKAGGPNYTAQFGHWKTGTLPELTAAPKGKAADLLARLITKLPTATDALTAAAGSDAYWNAREFGRSHDPSGLRSESNIFRYRRFRRAIIRAEESMDDADLARLLLASAAIGTPAALSLATPRPWLDGLGIESWIETDKALAERMPTLKANYDIIRAPHGTDTLKSATINAGLRWADGPALANARLEWPAWLREQAVCETLHRYGNLVPKPHDLGMR